MYSVLVKNPVSSVLVDSVKNLGSAVVSLGNSSTAATKLPPAIVNLPVSRLVLSGNHFVQLAGLSGATAVILGAYGAHCISTKAGYEEQKRIYHTANTYHFIHSLALLGVPLCRFPNAAGTFITLGMILFCGTCYYNACTEKTDFRKLTPFGGICLILGWLCLMF
ncbi:Inner membrane protein ygdD, putative [Pediculus humanus corporis]|uniref:Inner membrane protein ygdD, putative n=1 Tax=Pediculus humanus subsp. corporis TaxID=121224 RepID=E0VBZ9_PEDHC|nr:Inner membrane protein ygdD, putative [Pediculus humanus corporis]EEB10905.1 Inner membrane protein ygdD, putative [Pediculus humanus corporis]